MRSKNDGVPEHDIVVTKTEGEIKENNHDAVDTLVLQIHQQEDLVVIF